MQKKGKGEKRKWQRKRSDLWHEIDHGASLVLLSSPAVHIIFFHFLLRWVELVSSQWQRITPSIMKKGVEIVKRMNWIYSLMLTRTSSYCLQCCWKETTDSRGKGPDLPEHSCTRFNQILHRSMSLDQIYDVFMGTCDEFEGYTFTVFHELWRWPQWFISLLVNFLY